MSGSAMITAGWVISGLYAAFMLFASAMPKLFMDVGAKSMADLGLPTAPVLLIGILEVVLTLLYLFPPTALLGAVLTMGLLGGAMATQMQAGSQLYSHVLFSIYLGIALWLGLWLRDPSIRAVFPFSGA
ncbi:DoxX family protein [Pseudoroseicyclus sp. CXY001]|uniref:DoxX family protein n=1 Tax=Pseudoroseicyclus sp. CXY001 TaxID=3242492 RepID=UPI00358DA396